MQNDHLRIDRLLPLLLSILLLGAPLPGCGGGGGADGDAEIEIDGDTAGDPLVMDRLGYTLTFDPSSLTVTLARDGGPLLRLPADGIQLGAVAAVDDSVNYDPYPLYVDPGLTTPPAGLAWLSVVAAAVESKDRQNWRLGLVFDAPGGGREKRATLSVEMTEKGRFRVLLQPAAGGPDIAYFRLRPRVDATEAFYGLGEYFDQVDHRGKIRAMQLEAAALESGYNEAHVPVPFVIGTTGWGLFVENQYPGLFALATGEDDLVEAVFGPGQATSAGLIFHLFASARPLDVTHHYYSVTAFPRLPARWALGPWIWRDESRDQAEVEADLNAIRDLDLATTGYWIDRPYASCVNTFDFETARFPEPQRMIDLAHALGMRVALWHTPYISNDCDAGRALRYEAEAAGYFPPRTGLLFNKWGKPIDLTNRSAWEWWQQRIGLYTAMGIEGYKLDYGEDVVPGVLGARNRWEFADGSDERTMHAGYQLLYHRVYAETLPSDGGFLLCRAGAYGDQANGPIIWPGDLDADFSRHGETVGEGADAYVAVGGLPAALIAGLSLGPSGFPFYASDTGGYRHSPPDRETFTRWFQITAFSPAMQVGTSTNDVPWEPTAGNGFDQTMLGWYRRYARLHLRLFPYVWSYAERLKEDGRAIQRPFGLVYPELGEHPSDTFLLGDSILVAPVVQRGALERELTLPAGRWVDWWTGEVKNGGRTLRRSAPLDTIPVYLAEGAIVPLLRPTIDAIAETSEPDRVDSYATTPGILWPRIVPGPASEFLLFDGGKLTQALDGPTLTLSYNDGSEFRLGTMFEILAFGRPASVTLDGTALVEAGSLELLEGLPFGWWFDPDRGGVLYVKIGPPELTATVIVTLAAR